MNWAANPSVSARTIWAFAWKTVSLPSIDKLIEADRDLQQLLVAERSMIAADPQAPIFATLHKDYEKNLQQVDERFNQFKTLVDSEEEKGLIAQFDRDRAAWEPVSRQIVDSSRSGEPQARQKALEVSLGKASELFENMRGNLDKLTEISLRNAEQAQQDARRIYQRALIGLLVILLSAALVAAVMAGVLGMVIAKPINAAVAGLQDIAEGEGDLTKRLTVRSQDEIGELATWLNTFMEKLQGIIGRISHNTQALDRSSADLLGFADSLAQGTNDASRQTEHVAADAEQINVNLNNVAAAMEQSTTNIAMVASAAEEMTSTIGAIAENVEQANQIAGDAVSQADRRGHPQHQGTDRRCAADHRRNGDRHQRDHHSHQPGQRDRVHHCPGGRRTGQGHPGNCLQYFPGVAGLAGSQRKRQPKFGRGHLDVP